jgi:hypothetical protein
VKHAIIKLGDYTIPLIGVDQNATLEQCDLCHDIFSIQAVCLTGTQILCAKCQRVTRVRNQIKSSSEHDFPSWYFPRRHSKQQTKPQP